jgi:hypothetical protein
VYRIQANMSRRTLLQRKQEQGEAFRGETRLEVKGVHAAELVEGIAGVGYCRRIRILEPEVFAAEDVDLVEARLDDAGKTPGPGCLPLSGSGCLAGLFAKGSGTGIGFHGGAPFTAATRQDND